MKKLLITLLAVVISHGAFATAGNDDATSKLYVDTTVATRQDAVDANTTNTVMTYTDTAGTVGTKAIYDATSSYAEQQDALVSADVANTAIMNAINMEFTCAEYNPNDATDCWKWRITQLSPSKNLFDFDNARILRQNSYITLTKLSNGYKLTNNNDSGNAMIFLEIGNIDNFIGKTLTLSYNRKPAGCGGYLYFYQFASNTPVAYDSARTWNITQMDTSVTTLALGFGVGASKTCTFTNIQVEEGETATAYEPYGNLYLPTGQ